MGPLVYATNVSLDGYIEDATGAFDWSQPGEDVHAFYNEFMDRVGIQLLGRRIYETMAVWETDPSFAERSPILSAFAAAWQDSDKVVVSTTLAEPITARTRIVRTFDVDEVRRLKASTSADLGVSGAELAGHAFRAGLVDVVSIMVFPVVVGAGKTAFAADLRLDLELIEQRPFSNGVVHLTYRVAR
jgi:dihydrofolate reductase